MAIGWLTCLAIAALSPAPAVAQASADTEMDSMIQAAGPFVGQFALGGVLGFAAGFAIKKVGKIVVIIVGLAFILLQVLAYYGIIEIDWAPIARWWHVVRREEAIESVWTVVRTILFANVAAFVGAVPGFVLGLKRG